jgi:hypothetical protein
VVVAPLRFAHHRIEALGVEVQQVHLVAGAARGRHHAVAQGRAETVRHRMAVHHQQTHRVPAYP